MRNRGNTLAVTLAATALVIAVAGAGGPVIAAAFDARNADKVDGKHAVGSNATVEQRKNKLVATSRAGVLPNNIIRRAPDADKVDGVDSSVLLDRYTKGQIDAMASRRLLGFGVVGTDGALIAGSYFPGGGTVRTGVGRYRVQLPGYGPACGRPFPVVTASPMYTTPGARVELGSMNCSTGDVEMHVITTNSAGTVADGYFSFTFFSGDAPGAPASRKGRGAEMCELTGAGVRCE